MITVKYDPPSDTLYLEICKPYATQDSNEIERGVVARMNPDIGKVESIEVMYFQARFEAGEPFELPLTLDIRPVA